MYKVWALIREHGWEVSILDSRYRAWIASAVYTGGTLVSAMAIRAHEDYYYIPILSGCFLAMAWGMKCLGRMSKIALRVVCAAGLFAMAFLVFRAMVYVTPYAQAVMHGCPINEVMRSVRKMDYHETKIFRDHIADKESVTVLGNLCALYRVIGVHTPWKYPYQMPISRVSKSIHGEIDQEINRKSSRYLVLPKWESGIRSYFGVFLWKNYFRLTETANFELLEAYPEIE